MAATAPRMAATAPRMAATAPHMAATSRRCGRAVRTPPRTAAAALAAAAVLAGCGSSTRQAAVPGCPSCAATIAQTKADTYASVAKRTYRQEVFGDANSSAVAHIAPLPGLVAGLSSGNLALAARALNNQPVRHAVRARVVRAGRVLVDVGLDFVIAGNPRPLRAPDGRSLGTIEVSIQDVIGFIRLLSRLTGTQIVVRGTLPNHAASSSAAALHAPLPASGPAMVGRRRYTVSSFQRPGFAGERLGIWVLAPA